MKRERKRSSGDLRGLIFDCNLGSASAASVNRYTTTSIIKAHPLAPTAVMLLSISRRALASTSSASSASPAVLDFLAPSCTSSRAPAFARNLSSSTPSLASGGEPARKSKGGNAPRSQGQSNQAPRRKPLHKRQPSPSTSNSPVEILSLIRATEPVSVDELARKDASPAPSATSFQAHNQAVHNIIKGTAKSRPSFVVAFTQGWLPIRNAGGAARAKPQDLGEVLKLSSAELRSKDSPEWLCKSVRELALWLLGEPNAPGVSDWCWQELGSGVAGAERVVEVWDALQRRDHLRLRAGPRALDRAYKSPRAPPPSVAKHPAAMFGAYVAARSMVNAHSDTPSTFASLLPAILSCFSPSLRRLDERGNFNARIQSLAAADIPSASSVAALAHAWIRQVSLAQMWYFDAISRTPGFEIVRLTRAYFRTSSPALAWELWELLREGVESKDVKWIDASKWEASSRDRWLGLAEKKDEENIADIERLAPIVVKEEAISFASSADALPEETNEATPESTVEGAEISSAEAVDTAPSPPRFTSLPTAHLTQALVAPFISGFTRAQHLDQATKIWTWLPSLSLSPGVVSWTALLQGYARRGDVDATEAVFSDMVASGVEPDVWSWMERISARFERRQPNEAMDLADQLSKDKALRSRLEGGRFPDIVYSRLISGLLDSGRLDQAEEVLQQMEDEGIPLTIQTVNSLLAHHTRRKKVDLGNVVRCLRLVSEKGLEADVFTFTMVLQALLSTGQRDATAKLIKIMEATGIRPSVTTYGAIINNLANSGKADQLKAAVELIDEMERKGLPTNEVIYTSVIQGFLRAISNTHLPSLGDDQHPYVTAALTLKDRMESRGIFFNRIGFNAIIGAALSLQTEWGVQLALRTFNEMNSRPGVFGKGADGKHQVDNHGKLVTPGDTWYVLLDGFSSMGDWSRARALVAQMDASGFKVKSKTLARMVDKVQRGGYTAQR